MHRYEIATTIREQGKDDDMPIKWGSLYTVVSSLERHGFVEATGVDRDGARPERTTYRITPSGLREMADWTRELLAGPDTDRSRFAIGLSMLGAIGPDEAQTLLRLRADRVRSRLAQLERDLAGWSETVPRLFLLEDDYTLAVMRAEVAWLQGITADFEAGVFPGVAEWRTHHESTTPIAEEALDGDH
ncbi:PadR family transcriptional regulator [Naasia lichenicola]|uniref:PadR family transcriptional regulator n=2 Tax=Naasia lichenicola TaxID=2565933 RepID=A0A4V6RZ24_9MICO|nr:PadR family transcriptional regulator [Naasia lichenicola]